MTIHYAILGMLSYQPMTGYDLKKRMQDSAFMHWSGNNNQIYKALVELLRDGFVTNMVEYQESSPSKKIYSVTQEGLAELKKLAASEPEVLEFKKSFLVQLAWTDLLGNQELQELLAEYEDRIKLQMIMKHEKKRRGSGFAPRTPREALLWKMINENIESSYQNELDWVREVRRRLSEYGPREEKEKMNYRVVEDSGAKYIELLSWDAPIRSEKDALELVALCAENQVNRLLIHPRALSEDFFQLKTGIAGAVLQKLVNYSIRTWVILPERPGFSARFQELMFETKGGNQYRFFAGAGEAAGWLRKP